MFETINGLYLLPILAFAIWGIAKGIADLYEEYKKTKE